jgi:hypothetical protein
VGGARRVRHVAGTGARAIGAAGAALGAAALLAAASVPPGTAAAGRGFFVAATDDAFLFHTASATDVGRELGLGGFRVALAWEPGQTELDNGDAARVRNMVEASKGLRSVVTVYGTSKAAPNDAAARDVYCSYVGNLLTRFSSINDVVIWNEPNLGFFWQPQFKSDRTSAAPAVYEALLARCWDVLHALRPDVNVIMTTSPSGNDNPDAASNVSHSPGAFIRKMGAAYRSSGRTRRIFDTVGHNPYGMSSAESPSQRHLAPGHIAQGDLDRLVGALVDGFGGTSQPVPGSCGSAGQSCPAVWYLEAGYQTVPDGTTQGAYTGRENDAHPLPDSVANLAGAGVLTQSLQLANGIKLAYCQPYVGAFFNFLLWDEPDLARWQSGVLWADGSKKASFEMLREVIADIAGGKVNCSKLAAEQAIPTLPAGDSLVERLEWPSITDFSRFNEIWRFALSARVDLTYRASIRRVSPAPTADVLSATGKVRHGRTRFVQFPIRRLAAGSYRIVIAVTRTQKPKTVVHKSPTFAVR